MVQPFLLWKMACFGAGGKHARGHYCAHLGQTVATGIKIVGEDLCSAGTHQFERAEIGTPNGIEGVQRVCALPVCIQTPCGPKNRMSRIPVISAKEQSLKSTQAQRRKSAISTQRKMPPTDASAGGKHEWPCFQYPFLAPLAQRSCREGLPQCQIRIFSC